MLTQGSKSVTVYRQGESVNELVEASSCMTRARYRNRTSSARRRASPRPNRTEPADRRPLPPRSTRVPALRFQVHPPPPAATPSGPHRRGPFPDQTFFQNTLP